MDKKFQVFVSSTYEDLKAERQEVIQALLELDCIPAGMELFPAADDDQWTLIKRVIDDCDYYIVIVGGRYGSVAEDGLSYTQKEYEYAVETHKPVIAFVHRDPRLIASGNTEKSAAGKRKLELFRELVRRKACKEWATPQELGSVVSRSLIKLIKAKPSIGWVRADVVSDEAASREILKLKREVEELQAELQRAMTQPPEGSQHLARGDEPFELRYCFDRDKRKFREKNPRSYSWVKAGTEWDAVEFSWNRIFSTLAPALITPASESRMTRLLRELIEARVTDDLAKKYPDDRLRDFRIATEDFDTIKIQLRALGLIMRVEEEGRSGEYRWVITQYGDAVMTQLLAIKTRQQEVGQRKEPGSGKRAKSAKA